MTPVNIVHNKYMFLIINTIVDIFLMWGFVFNSIQIKVYFLQMQSGKFVQLTRRINEMWAVKFVYDLVWYVKFAQ